MNKKTLIIKWPNGTKSKVNPGSNWLEEANKAGVAIPTGCLGGSCGACEIEVNGKVIRACITEINTTNSNTLNVKFYYDPFW